MATNSCCVIYWSRTYEPRSSRTWSYLVEPNVLGPEGLLKVEIVIIQDNQGVIPLSNNPVFHQRTKKIDIAYSFVREQVESKEFQLVYVPTSIMQADFMTKITPPKVWRRHQCNWPRWRSPRERVEKVENLKCDWALLSHARHGFYDEHQQRMEPDQAKSIAGGCVIHEDNVYSIHLSIWTTIVPYH